MHHGRLLLLFSSPGLLIFLLLEGTSSTMKSSCKAALFLVSISSWLFGLTVGVGATTMATTLPYNFLSSPRLASSQHTSRRLPNVVSSLVLEFLLE